MSFLNPPAPFLEYVGAAPVPWSRWLDGVRAYFAAAGIKKTEAHQQRCMLIHLLGCEGQRQARTTERFELFDAKRTFDEAVAIPNVHFQPEANAMVQRRIFRVCNGLAKLTKSFWLRCKSLRLATNSARLRAKWFAISSSSTQTVGGHRNGYIKSPTVSLSTRRSRSLRASKQLSETNDMAKGTSGVHRVGTNSSNFKG